MTVTTTISALDWGATGSMLSGLGTLVGVGAVVFAAIAGKQTLKDWRKQKSESRRIDLAEQTLAIAYHIKRSFEIIRSPAMFGAEQAAVVQKLREQGLVEEDVNADGANLLITAQSILGRIADQSKRFDALIEVQPVVKAIFGNQVEADLRRLLTVRAKIMTSAQMYPQMNRAAQYLEYDPEKAAERHELGEAVFWEGAGDPDTVKLEIEAAINALEERLLPIIRDE